MRNFKKFLTLVLAVMMVVSSFAFSTSAAVTKFEDVDTKNEVLVNAVDLLAYVGVTKGVSETKFGADDLVTREQFALFMYRLLKGGKDAPANAANTTNFKDLEDKTYFYAISWANGTGIVNGKSDTTYGPKDPITLQEAYTMVVRALDYEKVEDLVYPYGYIEIAEKKGVELDKGLPSKIGYEDKLTRADMAIILYNAFFAETAIAEVVEEIIPVGYDYEWVDHDGDGQVDLGEWESTPGAADYVMSEKETYPRLCEKAFDVLEIDYQVVATPHYYLEDGSGYSATYDLGYEAAYLANPDHDYEIGSDVANRIPDEAYLEPKQLGLAEGTLDDYFLGVFKTFVTLDEDDQIEKVFFADCDMVKKTTSEIELGTVSANKEDSYYTDDINGGVRGDKVLSGKLTVGEEEIYAFNAPYSYAKNPYTEAHTTELSKYERRNEDNIGTLDFVLDTNAGDDDNLVYAAYAYDFMIAPWGDMWDAVSGAVGSDGDLDNPSFKAHAESLLAQLELVYYGGLYEADIVDINGDGLYDYIDYKPYSFFQVDSDEDKEFTLDNASAFDAYDNLLTVDYATADDGVPYIYTNGATVLGADFEDEDYVIGYVDVDTNTVKVASVVKPTVATIKNFKNLTGEIVVDGGEKLNATGAYAVVENIKPYDQTLAATSLTVFDEETQVEIQRLAAAAEGVWDDARIGDEVEFYIYNGVVLFSKEVDSNLKFTENLVIPTTLNGDKIVERMFNAEAGDITRYVYAWIDGETRYIPVQSEDTYPDLLDTFANLYEDRLCTYEFANGVYTLIPLASAQDADGNDKSVNADINNGDASRADVLEGDKSNKQWLFRGEDLGLEKVIGARFALTDLDADDDGVSVDALGFDIEFKSYTKVVVRTHEEVTVGINNTDVYKFLELDAADFTDSMLNTFDTVELVVSNNPDSKSRENLVVMYATIEAANFDFDAKTDRADYRIIAMSEKDSDEEGDWRYNYTVFNPFTGKKETVPGKKTSPRASTLSTTLDHGDLVEIEDGFVDDKTANTINNIENAGSANRQLVWIAEYSADDEYMVVVPTSEVSAADPNCKECLKEAIEGATMNGFHGIDYDGTDYAYNTNYVEVTDDTVVTVVKYATAGSLFNYGSMELADVSVLADPSKDYLCYNENCLDKNGNVFTGYADYLKAYVAVEDKDASAAGEELVADFIMIVVTGDEPSALDKSYNTPCAVNPADHD